MSGRDKEPSEATLLCDNSINELNFLMMGDLYNGGDSNQYSPSPNKGLSADKYNQMTKLDEEEENVDFMQMFNKFQNQKKQSESASPEPEEIQNVQFYSQPIDQNSERENLNYDQSREDIEAQNYHLQQQQQARNLRQRPSSAGKQSKVVRPGSANVKAGRFLASQNSQKLNKGMHYGGGSLTGLSQPVDGSNYQMQQYQQPVMNNMLTNPQNNFSTNQINMNSNMGSQRNGGLQMFNSANSRPPIMKKRTRPQSAAKNQMRPAKELQSVTNFTFQKAKQNQNQKSYVPDSLKNTDKERLYEEKINLKKELNEYKQENQILKTQIQTQYNVLRKKEEQIQNIMTQMVGSVKQKKPSQITMNNFLEEFQRREIQHAAPASSSLTRVKGNKGSNASQKDNIILILKQKLKDVNDALTKRERELQDLKQTLKFTKIKEFESELALNVQESQRLRTLLEREMQRQKIDPRLVLGLKQQITQYQQIIQNLQQNQQIQQENNEKLSKKLILQVKKITKMKELRKTIIDKKAKLEKKNQILQAKLNSIDQRQLKTSSSGGQIKQGMMNSQQFQQIQNQYEQQLNQQTDLINKLLGRMEQCGMPVSQEELMQMQMQQPTQLDGIEEEDEEMYDQNKDGSYTVVAILEATKEQRQIELPKHITIDSLREDISQLFDLADTNSFKIKVERDDQQDFVLDQSNFDSVFNIHQRNIIIKLEIILENDDDNAVEEQNEDDEEYEEDPFEKEEVESQKELIDKVSLDQVQQRFQEMKTIFQIKNIKKGDILKYILHGQRQENGKKYKYISIELLSKLINEKVEFSSDDSMLIARFLIDKLEEGETKIKKGKNYEKDTKILRKELNSLILKHIDDYQLYKGLQITSMFTRVQQIFEQHNDELEQYLEECDSEDEGTLSIEKIYDGMAHLQIPVKSFDDEIKEFIQFLAMRHSSSLQAVNYKRLTEAFKEDFNYIEDEQDNNPKWKKNNEGEFEPSSEEDELGSETEVMEESPQQKTPESGIKFSRTPSNLDELQQNILLEKVDEILMQIVKTLPEKNKIKTLTSFMMPYLKPVFDESQGKQFLIINQDDFIQFLLGSGQNQLGLQLDQSHVYCLLHLLVQEASEDEEKDSISRFILIDEFIELVKTYMKKELIMLQSKGIGIHYDILSKESVEFLFQIRSSLMHENKINEDSEDEDNIHSSKQQKAVPIQIREIFHNIIQNKNIAVRKDELQQSHQSVELMDFDRMLDILKHRMGILYPTNKAQEELKYLFCLDFKYIEMVMLVKFDKVMHDLDYISIDLLRQAQDATLNEQRKMNLNQLRRTRDKQIGAQKAVQNQEHNTYDTNQNIYNQSNMGNEFQGVSQSSKQEKKRKRPDDKKQLVSKKSQLINQRSKHDQDFNEGNNQVGNSMTGDGLYRGEDFDEMNVNENDINRKKKSSEPSEEYEEDYLQDDIPIDDDDDEDGMISDNYEQIAEKRQKSTAIIKSSNREQIGEHGISMDHSDDIQESGDIMDVRKTQEIQSEDPPDEEVIDDEEDQEVIEDIYPQKSPQNEEILQQQQLMEEVMDQMREEDESEDNYEEDLEMNENMSGMDEERIREIEEQVRAQMEEMEGIEEIDIMDDEGNEGMDEMEEQVSDQFPIQKDQMSSRREIDMSGKQSSQQNLDNYENDVYEQSSRKPEDDPHYKQLSGTKSGILQIQQEMEDEDIDDNYEDDEPIDDQSPQKDLYEKIESKNSENQFEDQYEDVIGGKSSSKVNSSVAISKDKLANLNNNQISEKQFGEAKMSKTSSIKREVFDQPSIHSSQNRYAQMSNQSSVQKLQKSISRHSNLQEKVSGRSRHSQIQQQVIEQQSKNSSNIEDKTPSQTQSAKYDEIMSSKKSQQKIVQQSMSQKSSIKYNIPSQRSHAEIDQFAQKQELNFINDNLSKKSSVKYDEFTPQQQQSSKHEIQSKKSSFREKIPSNRSSIRNDIPKSIKSESQKQSLVNKSSHQSIKQMSSHHSIMQQEILPKSIKSSKYSDKYSEPKNEMEKSPSYVPSQKSSMKELEKLSSKRSQKPPSYKPQIQDQMSEKYSERSLQDDIRVPSIHSSQHGLQQMNTVKVESKKAESIRSYHSKLQQSMSNQSRSGKVNFNPDQKSEKQFKMSSKQNSIKESLDKRSSRMSNRDQQQFAAQGNFMAPEDDNEDQDNYSQEEFSNKNEIAQDIHAGNSEIEDYPDKRESYQSDALFQKNNNDFNKDNIQKKSEKQSSIRSITHQSGKSNKNKFIGGDNSVQVIDDQYIEDDIMIDKDDQTIDAIRKSSSRIKLQEQKQAFESTRKEDEKINFHQQSAKSSQMKDDSDDYEF